MSSVLLGLFACAVTSLFFGSMFVPVKRFDVGDGIFVQWVMGVTIFIFGLVINFVRGTPPFQPFAMLGGALWAVANATAIPIFSMIGMGKGVLLWGITNCLSGWASSRYGLFGLNKEVPNNVPLNYIGLTLVLVGGVLFSRVDSEPTNSTNLELSDSAIIEEDLNINERFKSNQRRIIGLLLSLCAGLFYGTNFIPVIYIQQHNPDASQSGLDYVFSHFSGILFTTTVIFLLYATLKRNEPFINNRVVLPAFFSGAFWTIAQTSWFIANDNVSQAISFPINSMVPGVCASVWSVLYFKEIKGGKNLKVLLLAIMITMSGAICVGLSKAL